MLTERGIQTTVFDNDKTPSLLVGESLVPAVIPILRRLGIEDRVAAISHVKRGAALRHGNGNRVDFEFRTFGKDYPDYSYNIPRPGFDRLIRARAGELGVRFVNHKARVEKVDNNADRELVLSSDSLAAAGYPPHSPPELLVDATGRSRLFSRKLGISARRGPRNDIAHFAHFRNFVADSALPGQVVLSVLRCGWSWQIPLSDSLTSVGVVLDKHAAQHYGDSAAERIESVIDDNPMLQLAGSGRERVSEVMTYSNYQLISNQAYGKGWILLGDALGFVDPMLSPGVFMALESAAVMDEFVFSTANNNFATGAHAYYDHMLDWHDAWSKLIAYFYDGRLLSMGAMRNHIRQHAGPFSISRYAEPIVSRALSQLVSGVKTRSRLAQGVLHHSCNHLIKDPEVPQQNRIRSNLIETECSIRSYATNRLRAK
ncbi:hypothetical protein GCM10008090_25550 [Arenicella chitinivorans]|uniref:Uncharacterized protein n=2 Tax=Arenicella chitinivorans TaxID=1329800 RepID=A0A918VN83_9GAMM|nr:hypothetical protein GCM10008090_25550 [Arenicella chitinivorans]